MTGLESTPPYGLLGLRCVFVSLLVVARLPRTVPGSSLPLGQVALPGRALRKVSTLLPLGMRLYTRFSDLDF
jgi:hypothetical protein